MPQLLKVHPLRPYVCSWLFLSAGMCICDVCCSVCVYTLYTIYYDSQQKFTLYFVYYDPRHS